MCNFFDPNDLENQVNPCSETPGGGENGDDETPVGGSNCTSQCVVHNTCPSNTCSSNYGSVPPDPMWGFGGLSVDEEENSNN